MDVITLVVPCDTQVQCNSLAALCDTVLGLAGGYSQAEGLGKWKDGQGAVHVEVNRRIEIAVQDADIASAVLDAFRLYGTSADEKALYYYLNGKPVLEYASPEGYKVAA